MIKKSVFRFNGCYFLPFIIVDNVFHVEKIRVSIFVFSILRYVMRDVMIDSRSIGIMTCMFFTFGLEFTPLKQAICIFETKSISRGKRINVLSQDISYHQFDEKNNGFYRSNCDLKILHREEINYDA